ncbi:uncharacterized protein LOC142239588 [Haematobia irritans]|uniref:uncharacterized protein LOC142239588 n=1 Tax=Haematobia irritans TaxID=7368 RepID=UPI003F4F4B50
MQETKRRSRLYYCHIYSRQSIYYEHLRTLHKRETRFKCNTDNCNRIFSNIHTHLKHTKRIHFEVIGQHIEIENNLENISPDMSGAILPFEENKDQMVLKTHTKQVLQIILDILSDERIPRHLAFGKFSTIFEFYDTQIKNFLHSSHIDQMNFEELKEFLISLLSPSETKSEYLLLKYLKEQNILIDYHIVDIGSEFTFCYKNGNNITQTKYDFFYILVNIEQLFVALFSQTSLLNEIITYMNLIKTSSSIDNIIQSTFWKNKIQYFLRKGEENQLFIPIMVYFDDFEILNPLGAHSGHLKIGGVYIKILALPEHLNSKLTSILLCMLFFTEDRKKFGNAVIFKQLIEKLNYLQNSGISICGTTVKLITCFIGGDNLGMNSLLGFSESFSGLYYCRFCRIGSNENRNLCMENVNCLRSRENYLEDISTFPHSFGIKENSIFNHLEGFHVVENNCIDLMHDILEGVAHYDLAIIFRQICLDKKLITIQILNKRIETFDFGVDSRPPYLDKDCLSKSKFKMSASEMFTFIKYLPLLIGDLIPGCDECSTDCINTIIDFKKINVNCWSHVSISATGEEFVVWDY